MIFQKRLNVDKEPKEYSLEYAGFWLRLGAGIIDGVALGLIGWIIIHVFGSAIIYVVAEIVIEVAYFVGFWVWRGQTPGKMMVGIKIIRTDSSPITLSYAFLRYLGYIVSVLTLFVGFIWIAFDSRKQGIHDKIADTYVVKLPVRKVVLTESFARGGVG